MTIVLFQIILVLLAVFIACFDFVFAKLKSLNGRQVYELPKNISTSAYDAFVVWCEKFSVSLGSAKLG